MNFFTLICIIIGQIIFVICGAMKIFAFSMTEKPNTSRFRGAYKLW
jgi:hypothetical protein